MIVQQLEKLLKKAAGISSPVFLEHPENPEHGDYSSNVALVLAKQLSRNPREVAEEIRTRILNTKYKILDTSIERIEVAGPGFLNFFLKKEYLLKELEAIVKEKEKYGQGQERKTLVIDYSSPNIAKRFGIGHLRSTIIGQALYNLYKFLGWKTIGDNHLGDWGTQFGALLYEIKKEKKNVSRLAVNDLEQLYVKFHLDAEAKEEARKWFKKLEQGNKEARKIWKRVRDISLKEFERIYQLLDIKIDYTLGESFYEPLLKDIVKEAEKKGLAKKSRGAVIMEFPDNALPPAILLKSDEATNYFTRDLATVKYRMKRWKPDLLVYEVGAEQSLHLKQVFFASELLGFAKREKFFHVAHGLYRTKTGKFSTRKGQTVHLQAVLKEARERAKKIIDTSETARGLSKTEKEKVAEAVGIGAVKYNDLMQHPSRDIVFDWAKILNLKGNSAPYLQYTYARCKSILCQSKLGLTKFADLNLCQEEQNMLRLLYRFPEVVREAAHNFSPNLVCNFVFEVAQNYNNFYNIHRVLQAKDKQAKEFRVLLTAAAAQIVKSSLNLLGIKTLERM